MDGVLPSPADSRIPKPPRVTECIVCGGSNLDRSHVIADAIGGCWKPKLLCTACNTGFGGVVETDLHLDAGLRLAHEHFSWVLPTERRWVRDFRRNKQFLAFRGNRPRYVIYDDDGFRRTSNTPFAGYDEPLANPHEIADTAVFVMAWLTACYWIGVDSSEPEFTNIRDDLRRLACGDLDQTDEGWLTRLGVDIDFSSRTTKPLPYHQLQLSLSRQAVDVWITLVGYHVYRASFPFGVDVDPVRFAAVMDLRSGRLGFNNLPVGTNVHEPAWEVAWEERMRSEIAEAERTPLRPAWPVGTLGRSGRRRRS